MRTRARPALPLVLISLIGREADGQRPELRTCPPLIFEFKFKSRLRGLSSGIAQIGAEEPQKHVPMTWHLRSSRHKKYKLG